MNSSPSQPQPLTLADKAEAMMLEYQSHEWRGDLYFQLHRRSKFAPLPYESWLCTRNRPKVGQTLRNKNGLWYVQDIGPRTHEVELVPVEYTGSYRTDAVIVHLLPALVSPAWTVEKQAEAKPRRKRKKRVNSTPMSERVLRVVTWGTVIGVSLALWGWFVLNWLGE